MCGGMKVLMFAVHFRDVDEGARKVEQDETGRILMGEAGGGEHGNDDVYACI